MSLNKKIFIIFTLVSMVFFTGLPVLAQYGLEETAESAGIPEGLREATPESLIGNIINIAFSLIGVIFMLLMVYAGFLWMTAGGKQEQVTTAQAIIKNTIIGLIITVLSYGITQFVLTAVLEATQ